MSHSVRQTAAILASLHEGGHGLLDQGLSPADRDWLLGEAASMGLHESQARLWENHIGRSLAFWERSLPELRRLFLDSLAGLDAGSFHRAVNRLRPGVSRVGADQVSYHLHILLRYELEQALIGIAASRYRTCPPPERAQRRPPGVVPAAIARACCRMSIGRSGMFGYFPTYTLGSLYAAQLVEEL